MTILIFFLCFNDFISEKQTFWIDYKETVGKEKEMCAFASKLVCFKSDFIIIMNYLTSYDFFFFCLALQWMQQETEKHGLER